MKIKNFDTKKKILIVGEIGNNHEGDINLAKEMILLAAEAGADAVKFQTFNTKYCIQISKRKCWHPCALHDKNGCSQMHQTIALLSSKYL